MNFECPQCGQKPHTLPCQSCGEEIPAWAKYCPLCGQYSPKPIPDGDFSALESRCLCPDGNCIGILGEDGLCVICGKAGQA